MVGKNINYYSLKRADQAVRLAVRTNVEIKDQRVHVDPKIEVVFLEYYAHKTISHYKLRGYPGCVVQSAWNKTKSVPRSKLLTIREEDEPPEEAPLVCITLYHPQNPPIQDILKKNSPTLEIDPKLNTISDKIVVFGHKRGKNLRDILV